jgi:2'-5' RNA ligase
MSRLFLAADMSRILKVSAISQSTQKLRASLDARGWQTKWTLPENLHLTLVFYGEVQKGYIRKLEQEVAEACKLIQPLKLKLKGISAFPDVKKGRVLFIGAAQNRSLVQAQDELLERTKDYRSREEEQSEETYLPHITIARLRAFQNLQKFVDPYIRKDYGKLEVDEVILYESEVHGGSVFYRPLRSFKLEGTEESFDEF